MDGTIRSIEKRNQLVEQYLWCIDVVIRQNYALIAGAHLDRQDVYQTLAERLIRAVERYDPQRGSTLKVHIFCPTAIWDTFLRQFQGEVRNYKCALWTSERNHFHGRTGRA